MEYRIVMLDLPTTVKGYVLQTFDGFNTIVLNSRLNIWQNRASFLHEMEHIIRDDFQSLESVTTIEARAHK